MKKKAQHDKAPLNPESHNEPHKKLSKQNVLIFVGLTTMVVLSAAWLLGHKQAAKPVVQDSGQFSREVFDSAAAQKETQQKNAENNTAAEADSALDPSGKPASSSLIEGQAMATSGNYAGAIAKTKQYITEQNNNVSYTVYVNLGLYYKRVNDAASARNSYDKALVTVEKDTTLSSIDKESIVYGLNLSRKNL